jgi:hypothetical protein
MTSADQNDPLKRVRDRIEDQSHDHGHEFSVIVASANVLLALVLYGRIIATAHPNKVTYLAIAIALTSTLAAILAYYSIQMGILFVVGPLRLTEVVVSFMIAAVQLALFLWPTHVLGVEWQTAEAEFRGLRQWLLLLGLFAFVGPFANWYAARARRLRRPDYLVDEYESTQRKDRTGGFITCVVVIGCWALSLRWLLPAVAAGVAIGIAGLVVGIISQERVAKQLLTILDSR